jgi:hypothetical protein
MTPKLIFFRVKIWVETKIATNMKIERQKSSILK